MSIMIKSVLAAAVLAVSTMVAEAATVDILRGKLNMAYGHTKLVLGTEGYDIRATGSTKVRNKRRGTVLKFGISGKDGSVISHAGSGFSIGYGDQMISLQNIRIDLEKRAFFADIAGIRNGVRVLNIKRMKRNGKMKLALTPQVGKFVENMVSEETESNGSVSEVPLPAAGFLLMGALGGLALVRRRKSENT
ncbi:MAG: VPLPA-CTERM sorting domain-containing protein [Paracoccaceae bacterium]|nr:VPLPA-CTERM sorting domain-containing protein [Paracoccaceae bacterium]